MTIDFYLMALIGRISQLENAVTDLTTRLQALEKLPVKAEKPAKKGKNEKA